MRCARPPRPRPLGGDRNSPRASGTSRLPASERLLHPPAGRWLAGTFRVGRLGDPILQAQTSGSILEMCPRPSGCQGRSVQSP